MSAAVAAVGSAKQQQQHDPPAPSKPPSPRQQHDVKSPAMKPPTPPASSAASPPPPPPRSPRSSSSASDTTTAQLAQLLADALHSVDHFKAKYESAQARADRAERLLTSLHRAGSPAQEPKQNGEKVQSVANVLDAEARAERAERARDDVVQILHALHAQFADLDRYEATCNQRTLDARATFAHTLSAYAASHPRSPRADANAPPSRAATVAGRIVLPPLPQPASATADAEASPFSRPQQPQLVPLPQPAAPSSYPTAPYSSSSFRQSASFQSLPLPPPPVATGLATYAPAVPAKRVHRSRSGREGDIGAPSSAVEWEDQKRRRTGAWEGDADPVYHHGKPTSRPYDRPSQLPPYQPTTDARPPPPSSGSASLPQSGGSAEYDYRGRTRYDEHDAAGVPQARRDLGRVDARELVRGAKERARGYAPPLYTYAPRPGDPDVRRHRSSSQSSAASSWSIDEMLLETATDKRVREGGLHREATYPAAYGSNGYQPASSQGRVQKAGTAHPIMYDARPNGLTTDANLANVSTSTNGKVPARQLMTFGPGGTVVSGGGRSVSSAPTLPGGGFPQHNEQGQRICRQCGVPGREKDGKCVEKWGPGPEGPGTVCDRCRKKMKRVERRGALESASASPHALLTHRHSVSHSQAPFSHAVPRAHAQDATPDHTSRGRAAVRQDTLIVDARDHGPQQQTHGQAYYRDAESDRDSRADSRRSVSPAARYHRASPAAEPGSRRANHYADDLQSPNQTRAQPSTLHLHPGTNSHRRLPTPPYITSISTHEQYVNGSSAPPSNTHARPALSATRSAPRQDSRDSTEEFMDGDDDGDEEDLDVDSEFVRAAGSASKPTSRSYANNVTLPRVATLDERSSSSRWTTHANSHRRHEQSRMDNHDELDSDGDGDAELDASVSGSRPESRQSADRYKAPNDEKASANADADADIMDAVDAAMKTEE